MPAEQRILAAIERAKDARKFNALITETFDVALRQCDDHKKAGRKPFSLVVKDNFAVEGIRMTCASKMLANYVAPYTATVVQRLLNHGGCLIGKANMDEFAMGSTSTNSHFGPVKNPFTREDELDGDFYVAGGSSGGCAVAVAEGFANVAVGSDTGGSTRNPASFNGVIGFKPSYGVMSRQGLVPLANSFDTPSFFTRTIDEVAQFFDFVLGVDPHDCTTMDLPEKKEQKPIQLSDLKIGIPKEFDNDYISKEANQVWQTAIERLRLKGATIQEISLPHSVYSVICYHILVESDVFSNMARYDSIEYGHRSEKQADSFEEMIANSRDEAFNSVVRRRIFAGNFYNLEENKGRYFLQAAKVRRLLQQDFEQAFKQVDAVLVPSTSHSAPTIGQANAKTLEEKRRDDFFTQSANMCGLPAISVPFSRINDLPLGMQLISNYLDDRRCLKMARLLHELRDVDC